MTVDRRLIVMFQMLDWDLPLTILLSDVLPKFPLCLGGFDQTGDPYFDLSVSCAVVLIYTTKSR
jgi:hypothetical protein